MITLVCRFIVINENIILSMAHNEKKLLLSFGKKIREIRSSLALSQEELAEKAGVHRTYIGMIERGEKNVTIITIQRLAHALDVNIEYIISGLSNG